MSAVAERTVGAPLRMPTEEELERRGRQVERLRGMERELVPVLQGDVDGMFREINKLRAQVEDLRAYVQTLWEHFPQRGEYEWSPEAQAGEKATASAADIDAVWDAGTVA